jgi:membrane protein implicated in regulation of membrane protease activity
MTLFPMAPWAMWVLLGLLAAVVEVLSPLFGFIFVSVAVIPPAVLAASHAPLTWQLAAFAVTLLLLLVFVRPRIIARVAHSPGLPSSQQALLGQRARVTEAIDPVSGTGRVVVAGHDWAARSRAAIAVGQDVLVVQQDGIVLEVEPT